jgi:hypothetical protein
LCPSFAKPVFDLADREEHRYWLGPGVGLAFDDFGGDESVLRVEADSVSFRINHDANATEVGGHLDGELQYESQKFRAHTSALGRLVDRKTRKADDRKRIVRQLPLGGHRQIFDFDVTGGNRREAENHVVVDGHVRHAEVMPELILSREKPEEAIEIGVA